ncbi:MBL fold metallo-hydrolase [Patulibacter medicamentivorans]|uniref:MBL fold metallo-hydrolase n=1 Tax=Patulibacter medicamentivorans TaxID=1097667 RepID=UPI001478E97F|nr:MBL fold metallo-hydrolase [Patulibacter medicamentivorans]
MRSVSDHNPLPRELAPGVYWLGQCSMLEFGGRVLHQYASTFLVTGSRTSVLVEGGLTRDVPCILEQLEGLFAQGVPEPEYLFLTHTEIPHAGGIGRFLQRFPDAVACGEVRDLHLTFPQYAERFVAMDPGDVIDLGDSQFHVVEAVFRDLAYTRWGFDSRRRILFAGDRFSYSHYHDVGHCGAVAEEVDGLEVADEVALFAMAAFFWTKFVDVEPYIARLNELIVDELGVEIIAPTHGLPITDPAATMPAIERGLRAGSASGMVANPLDNPG